MRQQTKLFVACLGVLVVVSCSPTFDVIAGPAARLAFTKPPSGGTGGATITPAVQVTAQDTLGNTANGFTGDVTVALGAASAGGMLSGMTTVKAQNGVATFSNLSIDKAGTGYTLTAAATGLAGATSAPFGIAVGSASRLAFTVQPGNSNGGTVIAPVQVTAQDAGGNTATGFNGIVTLKIGLNPDSGTLAGTASVTAVNGVATFTTLGINKAATGYTLTATASGLAGATSTPFDVTVGPAVQLAFTGQPSNAIAGAVITPALQVAAQDTGGNTVTGFTGNVTVEFDSSAAGATLFGTTTMAAVAGVATFSDLAIQPGGASYALVAISGPLAIAVSKPFGIAVAPTGLSKQIVFSSDRTGTYQLYAMDSTGANQRQIATTGAGAGAPDVSPDGMRVVFATSTQQDGNQIWVMNADGSGQTQLINPSQFDYTANPSWSPDGSKIAFGAHDWTNGYQVFVMSPTGTDLVRLAGGPYTASAPRWSPDGSKIVFISEESGPFDVWVMNSDGTNKIRLTSDGLDHLSADFSPDGRKILFTRRTYPRGGGAGSDIWVMNADGTNQTNVTRSPAGTRNPNARWASGGAKILFVTARDGNFEIYVMNADGSNPTNLTNNPAADLTPVWAK